MVVGLQTLQQQQPTGSVAGPSGSGVATSGSGSAQPRVRRPKSKRLFVGGLPASATIAKLMEHFSTYGKVTEVHIL